MEARKGRPRESGNPRVERNSMTKTPMGIASKKLTCVRAPPFDAVDGGGCEVSAPRMGVTGDGPNDVGAPDGESE